ncbi:hypothetical protein Q2T40_00465 [Winogradskyella maritima]|nr:hypothetical protein [Winogradskyella maritima]
MEQKIEFICEWRTGKYTITELCSALKSQDRRPTKSLPGLKMKAMKAKGTLQKTT